MVDALTSDTMRTVRFYDHDGRETGHVYAVGRTVDECYANAAAAREAWRATVALLEPRGPS